MLSLRVGKVFLKFWFINKNSVGVIGFRKCMNQQINVFWKSDIIFYVVGFISKTLLPWSEVGIFRLKSIILTK